MTKDNSVSRCAERELRFVEPKSVRIGRDSAFGESQIPAIDILDIQSRQKKRKPERTLCVVGPAVSVPLLKLQRPKNGLCVKGSRS
jgi:hypothetical protein